MVRNNEVLGYLDCKDCGERATVHKTKRGKGRHLYKRCGCGCDQRTGAKIQAFMYENTQWLGEAPEPPPGYQPKVMTTSEQPAKQPETEPKSETKTQPKTTDEQPAKPLAMGVLALAGAVALATIGIRI